MIKVVLVSIILFAGFASARADGSPQLLIGNSAQGLERIDWDSLKGSYSAEELECLKAQFDALESSAEFRNAEGFFPKIELRVEKAFIKRWNLDVSARVFQIKVVIEPMKQRCEIFESAQLDSVLKKTKSQMDDERLLEKLRRELKGMPGVKVGGSDDQGCSPTLLPPTVRKNP